MELTLSQKFKLWVTLWAIILFVIMFISLATNKEETQEPKETQELIVCPDILFNEYGTWCVEHINDRYPWKLTADGDHQEMPEVSWTSHEKFKELCRLYWLDASKIWELENKYNLREWVLLAILISETSGWYNWAYVNEWCYNLGNVGNRDNWDRVCFEWKWESIEQVAKTLNNKYLWHAITLWCLSNAWSCYWRDDTWHRYATSEWNWEKNMKAVLNAIYQEELWEEVDPSRFVVKRVLFQ